MLALRGGGGRARAAGGGVRAVSDEGRRGGVPPEALHLLRDLLDLPPELLARLRRRAHDDGVDLDAALAAEPAIDPAALVRRLARRLGLDYREASELAGSATTDYREAVRRGRLRLANGRLALVPSFADPRSLLRLAREPRSRDRPILVTRQTLVDVACRAAAADLASEAADGLARRRPHLSAKGPRRAACAAMLTGLALFLGLSLAPWAGVAGASAAAMGAGLFLAISYFRLVALMMPADRDAPLAGTDEDLPTYTLLVPAYREAVALPGLIQAIARLDYPHSKLDVKILLEADDKATRLALERAALPGWAEILVLPDGQPRTKPRALNAGLLAARGAFLAIYDAEDRPGRAQLRQAVAAFASGGPRLAVVQAPLAIDASQPGFWAAQLRIEYAGLFRVVLPALARLGLPVPLGGTSNHFRTAVLRRVAGWDAYNVTEDADLGIRLYRDGYRAATISCATEEEAPTRAPAWFRQRSRWMKGWIVTLLVHGAAPMALVREAGPLGALCFLALGGGLVTAALVEPLCLALIVADAALGFGPPADSWTECLARGMFVASFGLGHGVGAVVGLVGQTRAKGRFDLRDVALMLPYWLCISGATWWALAEFIAAPHVWRKTEHVLARVHGGVARRSRETVALEAEGKSRLGEGAEHGAAVIGPQRHGDRREAGDGRKASDRQRPPVRGGAPRIGQRRVGSKAHGPE